MTDTPLVLGIETAGPYCAVALAVGTQIRTSVAEDMARGQAERLMGMAESVLTNAHLAWQDLHALAVGIGPGNFTGIRIGVSTTRGLALGLGIPAYGVSGFVARDRIAPHGQTAVIPAPRDMVYARYGEDYVLMPAADVANPAPQPTPHALAEAVALDGAARWPGPAQPPAPLYIKPADAAPARDAPPRILP